MQQMASKSLDVQFWPPLCQFSEVISGLRFQVRRFLFVEANGFQFEAIFSFKIQHCEMFCLSGDSSDNFAGFLDASFRM